MKKKAAIISTFLVSILLGSLLTFLAFAVQQDDIIILCETMVVVKLRTIVGVSGVLAVTAVAAVFTIRRKRK